MCVHLSPIVAILTALYERDTHMSTFTLIHVIISLIGIVAGLAVMFDCANLRGRNASDLCSSGDCGDSEEGISAGVNGNSHSRLGFRAVEAR
jgi:hypothetical protein